MKVLVATSLVPFGTDPERELSEDLASRLRRRGHRVEFIRLPRSASGGDLADVAIARSLELSNTDHVIALSFPACLVRHPSKVLWLTSVLAGRFGIAGVRAATASIDESTASFASSAPIAEALLARTERDLPVLDVLSIRWGSVLDRLMP